MKGRSWMEFGAGALLFAGGLPPRALPRCLDLREGMLASAALPRFEATPVGGLLGGECAASGGPGQPQGADCQDRHNSPRVAYAPNSGGRA